MQNNKMQFRIAISASGSIFPLPFLLALFAVLCGFPSPTGASQPWPAGPGAEIGQIGVAGHLPAGYEPSGAVWHEDRLRLLVVSDDGFVSQMNSAGGSTQTWQVGGNLEAIALPKPEGDLVLLGQEHPDMVLEFSLATGQLTGRTWDLTPWMTGPINKGLEALTVVGPFVYAGHQDTGEIFVFQLLGEGVVVHITTFAAPAGLDGISGLDWHEPTSTLFAIYDKHELILEMTASAIPFRGYVAAGVDQEGIAVIEGNAPGTTVVFITEDPPAGGGPRQVWRYEGYPLQLVPTSTPESLPTVSEFRASPNPFRRTAIIYQDLTVAGFASISVYDVLGHQVRSLSTGLQAAGPSQVHWDGRDDRGRILPSGMYLVRLQTPQGARVLKVSWLY